MVDTPVLGPKVAEAIALLQRIEREFQPAAFATSLGAEDMVLLDLIARHAPGIEVFTLDTGRLPPETYELLAQAGAKYALKIKSYFPQAQAVEQYVRINGVNGFYDSVAQRKQCCEIRKLEPLSRALAGKRAWITGLRREQSPTRNTVAVEEQDTSFGLAKFNPLLEWSHFEVWAYLQRYDVPYNALHDKGYPSIGCAPCTRAIKPGEPLRAGRWWWENADTKECGLHAKPAFVGASAQAHLGAAEVKAPIGSGRSQNADTKECGLHAKPAFVGVSAQAHLGAAEVKAPIGSGRSQNTDSKECGLHVQGEEPPPSIKSAREASRGSAQVCGLRIARPAHLEVALREFDALSHEELETLRREAVA